MCHPTLAATDPSAAADVPRGGLGVDRADAMLAVGATERFTRDIIGLHGSLSCRRLLDHVPPDALDHLAVRGDGLTTLAIRTRDLPHRYALAMQGFRLAQYLQLGWACGDVVRSSGWFCEPVSALGPNDVHVLTLDGATGRILGYVCLASSRDEAPRPLLDPARAHFPVETAHGLNVFEKVAPLPGTTSHEVRELKRFVRARTVTDKAQRLRITLELLLGVAQAVLASDPPVRTLVGDVEEKVALRHLLLAGLEVQLVEHTTPVLPGTDLMHLAYTARGEVKPFVSHLPSRADLQLRADLLTQTLASPDLFAATTGLGEHLHGATNRVAA